MCRTDRFIADLASLLEKHGAMIDSEYYEHNEIDGVCLSVCFEDNPREGEDFGPVLTAKGLREFLD